MKLVWLAAAAVAGVYLGGHLTLPWPLWATALASALAAAALFHKKGGTPLLAALALVALLLGTLRAPPSPENNQSSLAYYNGREVALTASVRETEPAGRAQRLLLEARSLTENGQETPVTGSLLAWTDPYPEYTYGDLLVLEGDLRAPGRRGDFDYPQYLAQQGIYSVMSYPEIELKARGDPDWSGRAWLYRLRHRLARGLAGSLPEPQASLAQALLLGLRRELPPELRDAFNRTGTTHILAISGLNISIVAGLLLPLGSWLLGRRRGYYLVLPLAGTWVYAFLGGLGPPVVRAALMASLFLWGHYLGRPGSTLVALAVAAAVMVGLEPAVLGQVSFQLSFLSMVGLALLAPPLEAGIQGTAARLLGEDRGRWARPVSMAVAVSLAAMAFTYPLAAMYFQRVSLVGLPATLLLLPALPVILVTSALTAALGTVSAALGQVAGWLAWPWLSYQVAVVTGFSWLPGVARETGPVSVFLVAGYYGLVGLALAAWRWRQTIAWEAIVPRASWARWGTLLGLATAAALVWGVALSLPDGRLHVYLLDVGQGDAILIQVGQRQVLIDGGPSPQALARALGQQLPFWDRSLDVVVLTHPEADHLAGLVEVLRRYRVGAVVEGPLGSTSGLYREWRQRLLAADIRRVEARAGLAIRLGKSAYAEVLYPPEEPLLDTGADTNNNSLVVRLRAGVATFLLPGDLGEPGEDYLLARDVDLGATVLKVAHHGSDTSTSPGFLAAVGPTVAVISVGADNKFGHPKEKVKQRLRQMVGDNLYLTSEQGTIEFITDGQRLWVRTR